MFRLAALAAVVGAASAYNRPEQVKEFHKIDVDASGHIDRVEVDGHLDRQFEVRCRCPSMRPSMQHLASKVCLPPCVGRTGGANDVHCKG